MIVAVALRSSTNRRPLKTGPFRDEAPESAPSEYLAEAVKSFLCERIAVFALPYRCDYRGSIWLRV